MTLVALFAMTMGAWADGIPVSLNITNISWWGDNAATCSDFQIENVELLSSNNQVVGSATIQAASCNINIEATDVPVNVKINYSWYSSEDEERWGGGIISSVNETGGWQSFEDMLFVSITYSCTVTIPPRFTLNEEKTEATLESMPTYDMDVDYELVRDMSVQMTATMGDGTDGLRYRVKKSEQNPGKYEPADMDMMQVLALVAVNDGIEQKALTLDQDYFCRIYKLDEQTLQPEGDGVKLFDFDFAPGLYALKAFAKDGSNYDGETALSNTFKLFEGYELKIAAGEFATYYKDEALYVEDEDAQLYTITSVNGDKANVVQVDVAKANMPILVKNNSADEKTILLIPTSEQTPDEVSAAEEFVGTLTATQIAASDATTERYAFNGKEFVWVKDAIAVGANRAWLEVPTSAAAEAHAIELVFDGETTRILSVENGELKIENYDYIYNLSGQRVSKDYKGVVVVNGKKVIRK